MLISAVNYIQRLRDSLPANSQSPIIDTRQGDKKMLTNTKKAMIAYAQTLAPSTARTQCYRIASLAASGSIAEALKQDHRSADGALRAARLMVQAGCAKEEGASRWFYGTFVFEDGSILN